MGPETLKTLGNPEWSPAGIELRKVRAMDLEAHADAWEAAEKESLKPARWWAWMTKGDIAAELSATFDIGLDVAGGIADWILKPAALVGEEKT